jgi:hypothetical protein
MSLFNLSIKALLQLTVFAAAPVVTGGFGLYRFKFRLTFHAQTNAGNRFVASLRYYVPAFRTVRQALATGQSAPGQAYRVIYAGIYLILNGPVSGPADSHDFLLIKIHPHNPVNGNSGIMCCSP